MTEKLPAVPASEITPHAVYLNRRALLRGGLVAAGAVATGVVYRALNGVEVVETTTRAIPDVAKPTAPGYRVPGEDVTSHAAITNYNTFYEFTTNKDGVARAAAGFKTDGWTVAVGGLVHAPRTFDLDAIRRVAAPEERVYRMRCVEAWSMVVPWVGYALRELLAQVRPMASAKYVAFETLFDPVRMPNQTSNALAWPYLEGLRLDEAMHPLTLLTTGLYGHDLPPQDGAPVRMIIPWKYGFKGIKSIVKITLVDQMPPTSWNRYGAAEYGFYANVNPDHAHPRWSQATEQRIGESGRRKTLMFNGYGPQVASLYAGMDLDVHY
ncbi:MAG: protein-methionine-sulfoxide reductase catalytic subunit MsrP [Proteobacteria bacterium]|nr:protein-methionine-sulfoxide reductase catalytic subunit MsrP [Pseudomonadota bacterium]